jgi:hypothetical protein
MGVLLVYNGDVLYVSGAWLLLKVTQPQTAAPQPLRLAPDCQRHGG